MIFRVIEKESHTEAQRHGGLNMCNNNGELFTIPKEAPRPVDLSVPADLGDYKVQHEIHRMMGLLRFTPNAEGEFIAKCAPDHFILPELSEYFTDRFGETPWSIIDEKRGLCLRRRPGVQAKIIPLEKEAAECSNQNKDDWEELWKHYHITINNEDRYNPKVQKQFMPKRYWKYLPEVTSNPKPIKTALEETT